MKKLRRISFIALGLFWAYAAAEMNFESHTLFKEGGSGWAQTDAADFNNDGKMDFTAGQNYGSIWWWENTGDITTGWKKHDIGKGDKATCVGGDPYDVDEDGWMDWVSAGSWFRNPGAAGGAFERIRYASGNLPGDGGGCHDANVVDIDGDGRKDVINHSISWWKMPPAAEVKSNNSWKSTRIGRIDSKVRLWGAVAPKAWGDMDGDGDMDVVGVQGWYENMDGKGGSWTRHTYTSWGEPGKYGWEFRTWVEDYDGDGDMDITSSEGDAGDGTGAWFQNLDGKGKEWKTHELPFGGVKGDMHGCGGHDFDGDGDFDIFVGKNGGGSSEWTIFENVDGKGTFESRTVFKGPGAHESLYADMDADGDIDIISKCWCGSPTFVLLENKSDKPGAIGSLHAKLNAEKQVVVSWEPLRSTAEAKYIVYEGDVVLDTVETTKYVHNPTKNGVNTFRVAVIAAGKTGVKGTPVMVTVEGVAGRKDMQKRISLNAMVSLSGNELEVASNAAGRYQIELYNTQGKRLATLSGKEQASSTIPLQEYKNGIYVLRLKTLQGAVTEKFILSR